jgi:uncharacterized delta-60 repeat protein
MTRPLRELARRPPLLTARLAAASRRVALWVTLGVLAVSPGVALAAPGDLDPSFDGDGMKTINFSTIGLASFDAAWAVLVQPDAKIVVAGDGFPDGHFAIVRLQPDGSFDRSFGTAGSVKVDFGFGNYCDHLRAAALQRDGKLVLAGWTGCDYRDGARLALARLSRDGSLDADFGHGGKLTIDSVRSAAALLVQPDGKLVVAGEAPRVWGFAATIARLNPDGSFDRSFGADGTATQDFPSVAAVALQPDGKLVLAGSTSAHDAVVTRLNPDGSPDRAFSTDGMTTIDYGGTDYASAVLVQPDGKLVVAGHPSDQVWGGGALTRLNPDGSVDGGFGSHGSAATNFGYGRVLAAALEPGHKIVLAGGTSGGWGYGKTMVMRVNPNGSVDRGFGTDGSTVIDYGIKERDESTARAIALQPDGKIVVAGGINLQGTPSTFAIARLEGGELAPILTGASPRCAGRPATIVGSAARDVLRGTSRADVIVALAGNDRIRAGRGSDLVCAGPGNDSVRGGSGRDRLLGQRGRDRLLGGSGDDLLDGGQGNDRLLGQGGWDRLLGRKGRDKLAGGSGRDGCAGNAGRDRASCERARSL